MCFGRGKFFLGLALFSLSCVFCFTLYLSLPGLQRRIEYLPKRIESWWRKRQPHPRFVPTPLQSAASPSTLSLRAEGLPTPSPTETTIPRPIETPNLKPIPQKEITPTPLPKHIHLQGFRHEWQKWNNCGPATLAMFLSYFGRKETQKEIASALKPNYDDKNVSLDEMALYVRSLGLEALVRCGGDIARLKLLLSNGLPVMVENWFIPEENDEMGHYRLLIGYEEQRGNFITYDSYNGPDVTISYEELDKYWRVFNRAYLLVFRPEEKSKVAALLGADMETRAMYERALAVAQEEAAKNPKDAFAFFNIGTNQTALGRYQEAATAFDRARELGLPWRMLWYQFGPFEAYYAVGRYQDLLALAQANLATSRDLEESHYFRGLALEALGRVEEARQAYQKALHYNPYFKRAAEALEALKVKP